MKPGSTREQAGAIFLRAAAYIRRYGWQESGMSRHTQPRCSMGALASAHTQAKWDEHLAALMYETLQAQLNGLSLTQFNHQAASGVQVAQLYEQLAGTLLKRPS